ncbi:GPI-anchor transamidase component PIGU-like [Styela clava]
MLSKESSILMGVAVRACLFASSSIEKWLIDRPEVSTPQSSWTRLKEGMALHQYNISLYDGDSFHDTPLMLHLFLNLKKFSPLLFPIIFVLADVVAALSLFSFTKLYSENEISEQQKNKSKFAKDSDRIMIKENRAEWIPDLICMLYMFNPFLIASCIAKSTTVFNNLFLCQLFYHTVKGNAVQSTLFLALTTYQTFYPVQLLAPVIMHFHLKSSSHIYATSMKITLLFTVWSLILFGASCIESWDSAFATVKFIVTVPDLTPNVGVFWYFFTEVFDHFHTFFLSVFQLNVLIFSLPLTIKLRSRPIFLMFMLCYIISTFKSYPSVADAGFCLCLMPVWSYTFNYLRFPFVTSVILLVSTLLCPIMWHLWIHAGTANANFYFATTLAYTTAHVFIMTDMLVAYLKYDFHLWEGVKIKINGKPAQIRLMKS